MILEVEDLMKILYSRQEDDSQAEFVRWLNQRKSALINRKLNS